MQDAKDDVIYNMRVANGFYHSVRASELDQFQQEQERLEQSGELLARLATANQKALDMAKKK